MQHIRFVASLSALLFAFGILGISLISSVPMVHSTEGAFNASDKKLYLSGELLPDHVGYPVLMAVDRVRLQSATDIERICLQTEYANVRLQSAQKLLEKGEEDLALTTITKAQKYVLHAALEAQATEIPDSVKKHVLKTIEYHIRTTSAFADDLVSHDRVVVDQLNEECAAAASHLASLLEEAE